MVSFRDKGKPAACGMNPQGQKLRREWLTNSPVVKVRNLCSHEVRWVRVRGRQQSWFLATTFFCSHTAWLTRTRCRAVSLPPKPVWKPSSYWRSFRKRSYSPHLPEALLESYLCTQGPRQQSRPDGPQLLRPGVRRWLPCRWARSLPGGGAVAKRKSKVVQWSGSRLVTKGNHLKTVLWWWS